MSNITKLRAFNYKKFKFIEINFKPSNNVIVGDNESGKSSILLAIDLLLSGSRSKVESLGLDTLFNNDIIQDFFKTNTYETLPTLTLELYFDKTDDDQFYGKNNSLTDNHYGISLICSPIEEVSLDIVSVLKNNNSNFPFEYYSISFMKFGGHPYLGFRKEFKHILLDNSSINNEYATNSYIKTLYNSSVSTSEKNKHLFEYRNYKLNFRKEILKELNDKTGKGKYEFSIKNSNKSNLESDLTITEDNIDLQNRGKGRQCFIKTEFALQKNDNELDFILLEEPENHLSHLHMHNLIERINESKNKQLFIATHSNMISSRLDLRNTILLNSNSKASINLSNLTPATAKFFIKAPDNNILEFILSKKILLVEGDAEYIFAAKFFEIITRNKPNKMGVHIISVGGTSFKRYMEIANLLEIKTAVVRDNDGDHENNCIKNYEKYVSKYVKVFYEIDDEIKTFEIALYKLNKLICDQLFLPKLKTRSVQQYMLDEKTDCAYDILDKKGDEIKPPQYIIDAISWLIKD
ncbi:MULTISPECIES: ATP-dependent endonuclease [unclassified Kaistella]|uniref:ATP-dependent nuclease n=1 Tax=unclassified Kaistella TaxID=2762626 RepID=UPI0027344960|nr:MULTISPECIES: TOPRIM nucleotidyl transferase/hydrolase domain-containing protein [unclassified Kaistella]MDP2455111.1 AAA family ATPase [Kaistella sp. SH11-4b]MDP2458018.1 AAA family ATPase [Kaistella sp. SH40-3]MDP2460985.1 AAA family ATPase [Kaistella sp. SH19-2b]